MLIHQLQHDDVQPPRRLNHHIPRDLDVICQKALAKERRRRYQSAGELADDLRRCANNEPIHARPASQVERLWRWCCRKPELAIASAVTALSLLVVAVVSLMWAVNRSHYAEQIGIENVLRDFADRMISPIRPEADGVRYETRLRDSHESPKVKRQEELQITFSTQALESIPDTMVVYLMFLPKR